MKFRQLARWPTPCKNKGDVLVFALWDFCGFNLQLLLSPSDALRTNCPVVDFWLWPYFILILEEQFDLDA